MSHIKLLKSWFQRERGLETRPRRTALPPVQAMEVRVLMSATAIVPVAAATEDSAPAAENVSSASPTDLVETQSPLARAVLTGVGGASSVFQAAGASTDSVTITVRRLRGKPHHTYEMGLILVDDATGKIGNLNPGDAGYAKAALESASRRVLLSTADGNRTRHTVDIPGGSFYMLYVIQDGTAANVIAQNPNNESGKSPVALFSIAAANPDDASHLGRRRNHRRFGWETALGGGRSRFNDLVVRLKMSRPHAPPDTTAPLASLSVTGSIPTRNTFDVRFTEPMKSPFQQKANYTLTLTSGPSAGQVVPINTVTRLDDSTVRVNLSANLAAGSYRFDIAASLADLAGNPLAAPRSFTFTIV